MNTVRLRLSHSLANLYALSQQSSEGPASHSHAQIHLHMQALFLRVLLYFVGFQRKDMPGARQASGEGGSNDGIVSEIRFKRLSGDAQEVAMATTAAGTDTPQLPALLLLRINCETPSFRLECRVGSSSGHSARCNSAQAHRCYRTLYCVPHRPRRSHRSSAAQSRFFLRWGAAVVRLHRR